MIGAGITGTLVALELVDHGFEVVVLDRRGCRPWQHCGEHRHTQYEIDELLVDLTEVYGEETAHTAYQECARGIDLVGKRADQLGLASCFRRSPSVFIASKVKDLPVLRAELDARRSAGFDVRWLEPDDLSRRWGLTGRGAIESAHGGSVDPYLLTHAGLASIVGRGARVHDRTSATSFESTSRTVRVATDQARR
ncbi:MAG: FAD-dependent oxidoreductase [Ilumatobacteraceae bacterium]